MLKVVEKRDEREAGQEVLLLDEIAREGARRMLIEALKAEADDYIERHRSERDQRGHALVVRNGRGRARKLTVGAGTVEVRAPRVDDRRRDDNGRRQRFTSHILPPYMRRSPKVAEVLPILYLRGLSTGDFRPALEALLGEDAAGLSPTTMARLTAGWEKEYGDFRRRDLSGRDYVYVWVDGIHFNIRLDDDRLCTLVMIGVLPNGEKELLAVEDGYRESAESWKAGKQCYASSSGAVWSPQYSRSVTVRSASGPPPARSGPKLVSRAAVSQAFQRARQVVPAVTFPRQTRPSRDDVCGAAVRL